MDNQVSRIQPVNTPLYSIQKSDGQGQRKDQPAFSLEEELSEEEKKEDSQDSQQTESPASSLEDLEVGSPKEGESGSSLNVVA